MLESLGFRVLVAEGGSAGIELFRKGCQEITAVLLDLTMPDLDDETAFSGLKRIRKDVPVILMSGYTEMSTMGRFTGSGPAAILKKPFKPRDLGEKLGEVMEQRG